jgi:peptidyl-prolyl cis-trans isomerase B (cyclophilin B)
MKRVIFLLLLLFVVGCTQTEIVQDEQIVLEDTTMEENTYATVETNKGTFKIELYKDTPITTNNFVKLTEANFYDGLSFHRYEPGFVIQGGDPSGDGTGGSEENIKLEVIGKSHSKGTIGMARAQDPDSASSQWFVNLADNTFLDPDYTVFGMITEGLEVAESLRAGDTMTKVTIQKA